MNENVMSLAQVAEFLAVSDYTVMSWAEEGCLETAGSPFLFTRESVEKLATQLSERKAESRSLMTGFRSDAGRG